MKSTSGGGSGGGGGSSSNQPNRNMEKLKKQKEKLQGEHEKCKKDQGLVKEFLKKKLFECFENIEEDNLVHLSTVFIQYCIYPRLMFSA